MTASDDLRDLARYFRGGAERMERAVKPTVVKAAVNVKTDAVRNLRAQSSGRSLHRLPAAIGYDITAGGLGAEIGPDQAVSGLGVGVELGSRNHAPMPFLFPASDVEEPRFESAVAKAAVDAWSKLP